MELKTGNPDLLELDITGMDCANCALTLERGVARLPGVEDCQVSYMTGKLRVTGHADRDAVEERVRSLGYDVAPQGASPAPSLVEEKRSPGLLQFMLSQRETALSVVGGALLLLSALLSILGAPAAIATILHLATILLTGTPLMAAGWRELVLARRVTINLLMGVATIGAVLIGETGEAATIIVLFALGESLEGFAADKARYSLRSLLDLVPQEAVVLQPCHNCEEHLGQDGYDGGPCPFCERHETRIPVADLRAGDTVLVRPGDRIPVDGTVMAGESAVDQSPITGESIPVAKAAGDEVLAGTINGAGALEVLVVRVAADSTLNHIIHMVEEAQEQRAPTQRFIDRFAEWYTPAVVILAVLIAVVPPLLFGAPFLDVPDGARGWLYRALALLIIACPCALVISTPVTIVSALTNAARKGILIKGGAPLEALADIRAFAFDKTGTLTEGQPALAAVQATDCQTGQAGPDCEPCRDLLALAAAVERRSEHPLAQAVVTAAEDSQLLNRYPAAQNVTSLTGAGVRGSVNGRAITIGSHVFFDTHIPHLDPLCQTASALENQGQTVMLLADNSVVRGVLSVADQVRPASQAALAELHALRPAPKTVMLTGDNASAARAIAARVGVDDVRAELLPGDKLEAVQGLEREYGSTAMVGDGINDAPALAAATVGIAMGNRGATQAMETADIVLMQSDLSRLPVAVRLSRRTRAIIHQNIALSLGIKAAVFVLALLGVASLWVAVFADVGASLIVIFNGMRMLRN